MQPSPITQHSSLPALPFFTSSEQTKRSVSNKGLTDKSLDLNKHLVTHPSATFYVKVDNDAMAASGIYCKDILIVDRSLVAKNNDIVLAVLNGEYVLRRFIQRPRFTWLLPDSPKYPAIKIEPDYSFEVWGVAVHAIRHLRDTDII